ncbi:MAG: recombinase A, partial [uncultured bacterium]
KVAPPFKQAEFDILYNEGISRESEIINLGVAQGLIDKAGAWFSYNGQRIGQGKENARQFLKEHPAIAQEIETKIRELMINLHARVVRNENENEDDIEEGVA